MTEVRLDAGDAAELAELLQFLAGWLGRDPDRLGASLAGFASHPAYGTAQLRQDLDRFTFLPQGLGIVRVWLVGDDRVRGPGWSWSRHLSRRSSGCPSP